MKYTHPHRNPTAHRLSQYGAGLLLVLMLVAGVGQLVAGLLDARLWLLVLSGVITLLLALPVVMFTTITPAFTVAPDGLEIAPVLWKPVRLAWDDVRAVKDYPLLPSADSESVRRAMVGKKKYRPAEGKLLIIPSLPLHYRIGGLFCGEGWIPVVAFTSRAHEDYDKLAKKVMVYAEGKSV